MLVEDDVKRAINTDDVDLFYFFVMKVKSNFDVIIVDKVMEKAI